MEAGETSHSMTVPKTYDPTNHMITTTTHDNQLIIICSAWHIDFKDTLHSKKMYQSRTINPSSKVTWGCSGVDGQKPFLISVMASGSCFATFDFNGMLLPCTKTSTIVCPYFYPSIIVYWFLFNLLIPVESSDSLSVVNIPFMKTGEHPKNTNFCNIKSPVCVRTIRVSHGKFTVNVSVILINVLVTALFNLK